MGVCKFIFVWMCVSVSMWWVCPVQLGRSDQFNRNYFLEFLAPSFFFKVCIQIVSKLHSTNVALSSDQDRHTHPYLTHS